MDDNEKKSSWDDLIQNLGAEPDESAFERKQPPAQEIPPAFEWSESADLEEPETAASDWNSLAESLGLEVEHEPEPEPSPKPSPQIEVEASADDEADDLDAEFSSQEQEIEQDEPFGGSLAPETSKFENTEVEVEAELEAKADFEAPSSKVEDELPPLPSQMDKALSETAWEEDAENDSVKAVGEDDDEDEIDNQGISGEAARSAFDALFSDGASSWGSAFLEKPKRDLSSRAAQNGPTDDDLAERSAGLDSKANTDEGGDEEEEERPKRKRSRRRRRGGRGRSKAAGEQTVEAEAGAEDSDSDDSDQLSEEVSEDGEATPKRRRSRRRSRSGEKSGEAAKSSLDDDNLDDDDDDLNDDLNDQLDDDAEGDDEPRGSARARQRHRNLPTWSEAIGMIVDSNLEQRAKSPSKPQASRGGRGRGGRRRGGKKPEGKS